jgi:uncharacterized membrane protein HdeD (DUF308 family)
MESSAATPGFDRPPPGSREASEVGRAVSKLWWVELLTGIAWLVVALVILQFDEASIKTVGVLVGVMFTATGIQHLVLAGLAESMRWLWALFGALFLVCGAIAFINPEETFAGLADVLGFLFLTVGAWWTIRAFLERSHNPAWWLGLISGIVMIVLAFWTSGQFFVEKAYTLLVFAGVWALMQGITDIARAFMLRSVRDLL